VREKYNGISPDYAQAILEVEAIGIRGTNVLEPGLAIDFDFDCLLEDLVADCEAGEGAVGFFFAADFLVD